MHEDGPLKKVMNGRALTSLVLLVSLVWLAPSGMLMHAAEHGGSEQWGHAMVAIHNTAAVIFTVSALVHLGYNWKALVRYFRSQMAVSPVPSRELVIALVGVCGLIALVSLHALGGH